MKKMASGNDNKTRLEESYFVPSQDGTETSDQHAAVPISVMVTTSLCCGAVIYDEQLQHLEGTINYVSIPSSVRVLALRCSIWHCGVRSDHRFRVAMEVEKFRRTAALVS